MCPFRLPWLTQEQPGKVNAGKGSKSEACDEPKRAGQNGHAAMPE
jgi:hypothetical protein